MPVTIVKPSSKSVKKVVNETTELVEKYVLLKSQVDKMSPVVKEMEGLKAKLKGLIPADADKEGEVVIPGEYHNIIFGRCAKSRSVTDMRALHQMLGDDLFYAIVSVKLADVDRYLTDSQQQGLVVEGFSETRTLKVVEA